LVGPIRLCGARSQAASRTDDNRCPLEKGGGERGQRAPGARTRRGRRLKSASTTEDTSFARSRDPCTSIGTELCARRAGVKALTRRRCRGVATVEASRSGKPGQPGGTGTGVTIGRTNARLAARTPLSRGNLGEVERDASEKEGGHGHRPREENESPGSIACTS